MSSEFKYAVAVSLLGRDLQYALQIRAELEKVLGPDQEIFLYSERQNELAATGELLQQFTRVFREDARVALVLYRPEWGTTPFTSIEADALVGRRTKSQNWRFVVVNTLEPPAIPEWLGTNNLWLDPERFTPNGVAAAVAMRVQELGGVGPVKESAVDAARRLQSADRLKDELEAEMQRNGPDAFQSEVKRVWAELKRLAEKISAHGGDPMFYREASSGYRLARVHYGGNNARLKCQWHKPVANSLRDSELAMAVIEEVPLGAFRSEEKIRWSAKFDLALPTSGNWVWRLRGTKDVFSSAEVADMGIKRLVSTVHGDDDPDANQRRVRVYRVQ